MATIDSLPFIDMKTLTQSEIQALSRISATAFDLKTVDDMVAPIIDRSLLNESAGSRRQTFSRPTTTVSISPTAAGHYHHHHHIRNRVAGLLPSQKHSPPSPLPPHLDPEHLENRSILNCLKQFLSQSPQFRDIEFSNNTVETVETEQGLRKRKRGRKPKAKATSLEGNLETVNGNGKLVDVESLGGMEDPYGEELRRRTEGMRGSEEELLGFMRDLGGQWCSRRKRRKIVDASVLGDALPSGWKLLLGLKRREGRASVYCRRYISPGGQHFVSCKEVSEYLRSYFGSRDAQQSTNHGGGNALQGEIMALENYAGVTEKEGDRMQTNEQKREVNLQGIDDLPEVQIRDLFECHKCDMTFDEKDAYLQHLLLYHQRITRKYRLGSSVGDGVIIKDGKYECQFCHKVFQERRRYNGHVGVHVRNYVRGIEESPGQPILEKKTEIQIMVESPAKISKMDALIEIAQNSMLETSAAAANNEPNGGSSTELNMVSNPVFSASISDHELNSESAISESVENAMVDRNVDQESYEQSKEHIFTDEMVDKMDDDSNVVDVKVDACVDIAPSYPADVAVIVNESDKVIVDGERASDSPFPSQSSSPKVCPVESNLNLGCVIAHEQTKPEKVNNDLNSKSDINSGRNTLEKANDKLTESVQQAVVENAVQPGVSSSLITTLQTLQDFPMADAASEKEDHAPSNVFEQRPENITGFEDMKLDEIENVNYSFGSAQESLSIPEVSMELANNVGMGASFDSSIPFQTEEVLLMSGRHNLTTLCVWCGNKFSHEATESQIQSDSVGYMCPTCNSGKLDFGA